MNKTLFLLTNAFPEKGKESFLVEELPHLANVFERVILLPMNKVSNPIPLPENVLVHEALSMEISKKEKAAYLIGNYKTQQKIVKQETRENASSYLIKYGVLASRLNKLVSHQKVDLKESLFYTYWLDEGAVVLALLKHKLGEMKIISRAHGYDLYEEDYPQGLPYFYNFAIEKLDAIFFISKDGRTYFSNRNKDNKALKFVSYLGIKDTGFSPVPKEKDTIRIVSCSSIVPLKRLELLANALLELPFKVEWNHFGDGIGKNKLEEIVSKSDNVTCVMHGFVLNEDILKFYAHNYVHLFVNVSRTEGLPVSLMEASSFGIPLLATDVRGTKEVCNRFTGLLLNAHCSSLEIAQNIEKALDKKWDREAIREYWRDNFRAEDNFKSFARIIVEL